VAVACLGASMNWTWAAAAAMALSVAVGGAADARAYLLTVTLDSELIYPPGEERYLAPIDSISFQQTWTVGDFPGTPPNVVDPGCDAPCFADNAEDYSTTQAHNTGYTAALLASLGLGPPALGEAYGRRSLLFVPPALTSDLLIYLTSAQLIDTPDGSGGTRSRFLEMSASASTVGPDVPGPFTNDNAATALTAGGSYRLQFFDTGCPDGSCQAFSHDYIGSFTATALGVPEPATWTLMILGFGAAGAQLRVRRRAASASRVVNRGD